ncbi:hypothetical protein A3B45_00385 [Candidatus Daviesbacteria bacterium RIFCSPLOWO2_01_FULL_39_12]|uniref:Beta-ketoacyl-ACP reductase n=1 Tax=Candidatus Daviesbacteria bacterium RIFCSPLOWO2_01_FULL_39_12 TaxID=1797785 RepID=A0A1F5KNX1_9BACT|nr:MAG: hypothetical protein A3B45_00385 [Candidatus Daviesbacteria bacterium RIFCSPLOWO2_01_FULL_39_12]
MKRFEGKIAIVTGSSRGLGKAIAFELASEGATLILHASKKSTESTKTFHQIKNISPNSELYFANFLNHDEIVAMMRLVQKKFRRVDILINNAGAIKRQTFLKMTDEEWDIVTKVNIYGTYFVTKLLLPSILKSTAGRIVNMSSICGLVGEYGLTGYCMSKAAIIGFTKALAKEIAKYNITVNAICPAFTDAGMANEIERNFLQQSIQSIPLKRVGKKEEVAKLVTFLCSEDAGYITGQAISINGGLI